MPADETVDRFDVENCENLLESRSRTAERRKTFIWILVIVLSFVLLVLPLGYIIWKFFISSYVMVKQATISLAKAGIGSGELIDKIVGDGEIWMKEIKHGEDCTKHVCNLDQDSLKFFIVGDWGGLPVWPFFSPAQVNVANAMGIMGREIGTSFQMALGDNFYMVGVTNEFDKRFSATFENIYSQQVLRRTPWYIIAGNHDHHGNTTAQIAYSKRSWRWNFPSLFYTVKFQLRNSTTVDIVMIDTVVLCGQTRDGKFDSILGYLTATSSTPKGPSNKKKAEEEWLWIENQLNSSRASYLFVAGHYPIYSIADHGPTKCLVDRLNPLLLKYNVSAYFSGHDHNLQHLQVKREPNGVPFDYVLSGGGAFLDSSSEHLKDVPVNSSIYIYPAPSWLNLLNNVGLMGSGGFVMANISSNEGKFTYFNGERLKLHEFSVKPRVF